MPGNINWLEVLNTQYAETQVENGLEGNPYDSVFVVGAPRSGTTIFSQFLFSHFDLGYVSNLMACFWGAPITGALLSEKLLGKEKSLSTVSDFGATPRINDSHEFGRFWRDMLGYEGMQQKRSIDSDDLRRLSEKLDSISKVFQKSVGYKVFQLGWHILQFQELRPNTKWIWIERSVEANALSLLYLREKLFNDRAVWASARPRSAESEEFPSYYHEVVFQVTAINSWYRSQFDLVEDKNWLHVSYEDFVAEPSQTLDRTRGFLNEQSGTASVFDDFLNLSESKLNPSVEDLNEIRSAIEFYKRSAIER